MEFSLIQSQCSNDGIMSIEEIKAEILSFLVAPLDTTAAFVSAFINHVIDNTEVSRKLLVEILDFEERGVLSSPVVSFDETNSMSYFKACITETLRVSPSTAIILPRLVSEKGLVLNGQLIPAKTEIGANPVVINRNSDVFGPDSHYFRPERWLENEEAAKRMHKWMFTWGWGSRDCIGRNFVAIVAQKLLLEVSLLSIKQWKQKMLKLASISFSENSQSNGFQMIPNTDEAISGAC